MHRYSSSLWRLDTLYKSYTNGRFRYNCASHAGLDIMHLAPGISPVDVRAALSGSFADYPAQTSLIGGRQGQ